MKRAFLIAAVLMLMVPSAFAFDMGSGTDGTKVLSCGLSNQVTATYIEDGASGEPAQWYAIGTYHLGGTKVYGTAQDITTLYSIDKDPGATYDWANMPQDSTASSTWSGSWSAL